MSDDYSTWTLFGVSIETYEPTHIIRENHLVIAGEALAIIIVLAVYVWVKTVRKLNTGVVPQAIFLYFISTAIYGWLRVTTQYNKVSLFFANWHVLCEIVLLLDILQGENIAVKFYDVLLPIQWTMSSILVFLPLKYVLLFMQPFGFLADNMLVWVQIVAFYETRMNLYLWGVVGAVIHVIMLTVGILDPIMGESGIGLTLGSLLLVPFALCYTIQAYLYGKSWKEHAIIPYLDLGVHKRDPTEQIDLNLTEFVDLHVDPVTGKLNRTHGLVHDDDPSPPKVEVKPATTTPAVVTVAAIPLSTLPSSSNETKESHPDTPSSPSQKSSAPTGFSTSTGTVGVSMKQNGAAITEKLTIQTKTKSRANLNADPNKPNIPLGSAKLNTVGLDPAQTQTRLKKTSRCMDLRCHCRWYLVVCAFAGTR